MPHTLPDDTGYDTENNHSLETGWQEVANGLGRMLIGNGLQILLGLVLVGGVLVLPDLLKSLRSANAKADWVLILSYTGGAAVLMGWAFAYWLILSGQWKCLAAPERRLAKAFIFASLLCLLAGPVLGILGGWMGGLDDVVTTKTTTSRGLEARHYVSIASGLLATAGSVLFIFFLRACAECFQNRLLIWSANAWLLVTLGLMALALGMTFQIVQVDWDARWVQKALRKGDAEAWKALAPFLTLGLGGLVSYLWYLVLLSMTRNVIENGSRNLARSPAW